MSSYPELSRLAQETLLRVLLVNAGEPDSLTWSGLVQPLRLAARLLGAARLHVDVLRADQFSGELAGASRHWHLVLLVADEAEAAQRPPNMRLLLDRCHRAACWGGVGAGVLWLAEA